MKYKIDNFINFQLHLIIIKKNEIIIHLIHIIIIHLNIGLKNRKNRISYK